MNIERQDLNGARTPTDLQRRFRFQEQAEEVKKMKEVFKVDDKLSISSKNPVQNKVITEGLNGKVNKEFGKELSSNDFTDEEKEKLGNLFNYDDTELKVQIEELEEKAHLHNNKEYNLSLYKVNSVVLTDSKCINKNNRVVISVKCATDIVANTITTLFNLPQELRINEDINFIVLNESLDFGIGYLKTNGELQVKFSKDISSEIFFNIVYDIEQEVV